MAGLYKKNPKNKSRQNTKKYYAPKAKIDVEVNVIEGKIVNIENENGLLKNEQLIISEKQTTETKQLGSNNNIPVIVGILNPAGEFIKDPSEINKFRNENKNLKLFDMNENEIGSFSQNGELKFSTKINLNDEKIIIGEDGKLFEIRTGKGEDEQALNRDGENVAYTKDTLLQDETTKKYYLKTARVPEINTQKGVENLQKQPVRSALKGARAEAKEEAMKIGDELREKMSIKERHQQDRQEAQKIAANARKAKKNEQVTRL